MSQSLLKAITVSRAPLAALGATGFLWGTFAAMVPVVKMRAEASDAFFGLALLGSAAGGMLAMYLAPALNKKLGRLALPVLGLCSLIALQLPVLVTSPLSLFPVMLALGMVVASFDVNANLRISSLEEQHGLHLMNLNHAMFSLCFGMASLAVGAMRARGMALEQVLPLMSVVIFAAGVLTIERRGFVAEDEDQSPTPDRLPWRAILLIALMMFVAFVSENTVETWSALFLERELGGAPGQGGFGPAMLGFTMAAFRLAGQLTTERMGERRVIFWSGLIGMCGAVALSQAPTQGMALLGISLMATGLAVIVPTATSLLGKLSHRRQRDMAISRAWMIGFVGFFVGPTSIGYLSEHFGLRAAFLVVAGLIGLIIPAILSLPTRKD